jgi:ATP adenylyltransferase
VKGDGRRGAGQVLATAASVILPREGCAPMERLWTPWRMAYVTDAGAAATCFLCERVAEDRDADNLILLRGPRTFAILNLYPYNTAHTMVAPYAHTADLTALDAETATELMATCQRLLRAISAEYRPDGYNVGMNLGRVAGAGLPDHLHLHVVPRWNADTNFMPVIAETKVLPETLDRTYQRLRARLSGDG